MTKDAIKALIDEYIRSEFIQALTSERDSDFFTDAVRGEDRASRCHDAAEFGCDGKTHYEVINDWRNGLSDYLRSELKHDCKSYGPCRINAAMSAHFDAVESWHETNGSLHEEIG